MAQEICAPWCIHVAMASTPTSVNVVVSTDPSPIEASTNTENIPCDEGVPKFTCIDLFSGTGGISLAVQDFAHTVQYCELNMFCQAVLIERMLDGRLDRAPIHSDVSNLFMSPHVKPTMLVGGFPCQDVSSMGLKAGISEGTRSGLFHQVMRIVDECPTIQVVFLENVSNILKCGMQDVVYELNKRGFSFQWTTRSASMFGAPHVRSRWFCLAVRGDVSKQLDAFEAAGLLDLDSARDACSWQSPGDIPPVVFKPTFRADDSYDENWSMRCACLGNAVVPTVVRHAFVELARACRNWPSAARFLADCSTSVESIGYPYAESGLVHNGKYYAVPKSALDVRRHTHDISVNIGGRTVNMLHFPTPRRGITYASSLTERSLRDLPTVIVHSTMTERYLNSIGVQIDAPPHTLMHANVNFIEWMMGYEKDWTKLHGGAFRRPPAGGSGNVRRAANAAREREEDERADGDAVGDEDEQLVEEAGLGGGTSKRPSRARGLKSINGMHVFMREHPGKSIMEISRMWKELAPATQDEFRAKARAERLSQAAA